MSQGGWGPDETHHAALAVIGGAGAMVRAMLRHPGGIFNFSASVVAGSFIATLFAQSFTITVPGMTAGLYISDHQAAALLGMVGLTISQRLLQFIETTNIGRGKK